MCEEQIIQWRRRKRATCGIQVGRILLAVARRSAPLTLCPSPVRGNTEPDCPPPNCLAPVKLLLAALRSSLTGGTEGRLFWAVEVWLRILHYGITAVITPV